jgi:hypothetical protein
MLALRHRRSVPGSGRRSRTVAHNSGLRQPGRLRANHWHMRRGGQLQPRQGWNSRRRSPGGGRQGQIVKHRVAHETRTIPIPPEHVKLLRARNRRYGTTPDGRIFQTARAASSGLAAYSAVWAEARKQALTPAQADPAAGGRLCATLRRGSAYAYWAASRSLIARAGGW